jgi:uncharacterized tellurite resistance protein B-like protein
MPDTKFDKAYEAALQAVKNSNGKGYEARIDALIKASKVLEKEANTLASQLKADGIDSYRVEEAASMFDVEGVLDRAKDNLKRKTADWER